MTASNQRLYFLLQRTAHSLKKEADARLKEAASITAAQAGVLVVLRSKGPLSQRQLADALKQRESAMTRMTERLIKAGYIHRKRSETDARAWILALSDEGRQALEKIEAPFTDINAMIDDAFGREGGAAFAAGLHLLLGSLGQQEH